MTSRLDSSTAIRGVGAMRVPSLFFESRRWPDELHIAPALMGGPIDRKPAAQVFFDGHVDWAEPGDHLLRLGGPSGTQPIDPV